MYFWKHDSFPARLRPNLCWNHASEKLPSSALITPCERYVTGWEDTQHTLAIVILDLISMDSVKKAALGLFFTCFTIHSCDLNFYCFWKHPQSYSISSSDAILIECLMLSSLLCVLGSSLSNVNTTQKSYYAGGRFNHITTVPRDLPKAQVTLSQAVYVLMARIQEAYHTNWPCRRNKRKNQVKKICLKFKSELRFEIASFEL